MSLELIRAVFNSPEGQTLLRELVREYVYEMDTPTDEVKLNRALGKRELILDLLYTVRESLDDLSNNEFYPLERN